jgi:hypothetical protein
MISRVILARPSNAAQGRDLAQPELARPVGLDVIFLSQTA